MSCNKFLVLCDDFDLPIAIHKRITICTKHPISHFVSCNFVSSSYRACVSSLSAVSIIGRIYCNTKMKEAMENEMRALGKNDKWELVSLTFEKKVAAVNGI